VIWNALLHIVLGQRVSPITIGCVKEPKSKSAYIWVDNRRRAKICHRPSWSESLGHLLRLALLRSLGPWVASMVVLECVWNHILISVVRDLH